MVARRTRRGTTAIMSRTATAAPSNIAGMVVFIDPGHNGANDASISRQVPTGRGGTKDCQTSGTSTNGGYHGAHVHLGHRAAGPRCAERPGGADRHVTRQRQRAGTVCRRARQHGQRVAPQRDREHPRRRRARRPGEGSTSTTRPRRSTRRRPDRRSSSPGSCATRCRPSGIPPANYIGQDGLYGRADLAGLNLAQYPSILVECGNMKNPVDSALMESPDGQAEIRRRAGPRRRGLPGQPGPGALARCRAFQFLLRLASTSAWIFFSPSGAKVFSKKPPMPPAPVQVVFTVTLDPGPAGATVQLVTMDEFASFSMTVWPATSTLTCTSRTRDLVACSFHLATVPGPLPALQHLVFAVLRRQNFRPDRLVVGHRGECGRGLDVDQDRAGRAHLSHQAQLLRR